MNIKNFVLISISVLLVMIFFIEIISSNVDSEIINIAEKMELESVNITGLGIEYSELHEKEGVGSRITFIDKNANLEIGGDVFENIKTSEEDLAYIILNENGEITKADLTASNDTSFIFNHTQINLKEGERVIYKNGKINVYGEQGGYFELKQKTLDDFGKKIEQLIEIKFGEEGPISIEKDTNGNQIITGNLKIGENSIKGLNKNNGKITLSNQGKIIKVWEGTEADIENIKHQTLNGDLNIYYEKVVVDWTPKKEENYFNYGDKKIHLGGDGFKSIFDETSPIINIEPAEKKPEIDKDISEEKVEERIFEISPKSGSDITIENRNSYYGNGEVDKKNSQAPAITISGEGSVETWAEIKNDGVILRPGKSDSLRYRVLPKGIDSKSGMALEFNVIDKQGNSLINDEYKREMKASLSPSGDIMFSTTNARVDIDGIPICPSSDNSITGDMIDCKANYFRFRKEYLMNAAFESAKEEYNSNLEKVHDFEPEYAQNLDNIALYMLKDFDMIMQTQIEIMKELPDYTEIKLFVEPDFPQGYLKEELPQEIFSRITFIEVPKDAGLSVWAQDLTEGDNKVQILPLTYLGGGGRRTPDAPDNEFMYQLEDHGIDVRKIPVEFGGGNVFITRNKEKEKILLIGSDSYLETSRTYEDLDKSISEEEFKNILKNSFHTDSVEIIGVRDSQEELEKQPRKIFHIDQTILPIDDGVIAMPTMIDLQKPSFTEQGAEGQTMEEFKNLAEEYDISYNSFGVDYRNKKLSAAEKIKIIAEQRKIKAKFQNLLDQIYDYEESLNVQEKLTEYREQMKSLGFEIIDLKTYPESIRNYQAYTNSIVYADRNTGQKTIIMPIFPDGDGEYRMRGLNLENKKAYENAGYKVKVVKDRAFKWQGNLHCITILAQSPQNPPSCSLYSS